MGLPNSVEGARHFAERTLHSLVRIPRYVDSLRSLRSGYVEYGTRIALGVAAFLTPLASPSSATAFSSNGVPENQRNSITLTSVKKQEVPPPVPGEELPPVLTGENESRELALISEPEPGVSEEALTTTTTTSEVTASVEAYPTTFPKEFGDLKRDKLLIKNYGTKSGLAPGDPELLRNLFWGRNNYAANPNMELVVATFDSIKQMEANGVRFEHGQAKAWPYDAWGSNVVLADGTRQKFPPTFLDGQIRWFASDDGSRVEVYMTMPEAREGVIPHWSQLQVLSVSNSGGLPIQSYMFYNDGENEVRYSLDQGNQRDSDPNYQLIRLADPVDGYRRFKLPFYIVSK